MACRVLFLGSALLTASCLKTPDTPETGTNTSASTGFTTSAEADTTSDSSTGTSSSSSDGPPGEDSSAHSTATGHTDTTLATVGEPECGDKVIDIGEECDNGYAANADDAVCLSDCTLASCGDGHVFADKEECDDQNNDPADGCHTCYRTRRVFITSAVYQGAQFMGLEGADQRCRSLAAQAGLMNAPKFKAWLSDSRTAAKERLHHARGRYELINGLLVADSWDALVAGNLVNPINVTEKSETFNTGVFTSTTPDGSIAMGADHCADWTSLDPGKKAFWGASSEIDANWTLADTPANPQECAGHRALYCFEQE